MISVDNLKKDSKAEVPKSPNLETDYEFFNGFGGFIKKGKEYEILLEGNNKPPAPWINVIANKNFGFFISESGAGFTWSGNSRENKITPWSNDPVSDKASEAIYIKDEVTGNILTPMSLGRTDRGNYRVRHGFGYSVFHHEEENITQELTVFTPLDEPIKLWELKLTNTSEIERYLSLTYYVEWVLGTSRDQSNPYILTDYSNEHEYLSAKSIYNYNFHKHNAFIFSSEMITGYTGDRQEFFGLKGGILNPRGLNVKLSNTTGVCYDACGTIQVSIAIKPGECKTVIFGLGQSDDLKEISSLRHKYNHISQVTTELDRVKNYWEETLGAIKVKTNDRAIDIMVNGWLLYQTISCRINARAAFYQCGGAYGFRDQLQDTLSLLYTDPDALKGQILTAAGRQFVEGDVQHWWHPPMGIGVRTRISDDLLWLPYCTAAYIRGTGDYSILQEKVPYITGPLLEENQHDAMFTPNQSDMVVSIYEHCKKAILYTKYGNHGLPLMGGGDWNDGMSEVGIKGTGESVWLGWFLIALLGDFIPLSYHEEDFEFAKELVQRKETLRINMEENAWDGEWYLRAFYDDQTKLGSKENDECMIDSISQSWSVISKGAKKDRALTAMHSTNRYLVREDEGVSLLLTPPFDKTNKNPGYIKNYYPGIRENGGQYTHAAVWLAIANTMIGDYNMAHTLFTMLNPIHITLNKRDAIKYEKEPYAMIADISLSAPYTGRGGWSWYTGSAGWMYQGLVNWFLGIRRDEGYLIIDPSTPAYFGDFSIQYKHKSTIYEIKIESRSRGVLSTVELMLDGEKVEGNRVKLIDDGKTHLIVV
ncbi:GH36-type glycosyl hydrolase domain-containing protein [Anaerosporobacter sp.]